METYKKWEKRYKKIEKEDIPRLTDKLLVCAELIDNKNFKEASNYSREFVIKVQLLEDGFGLFISTKLLLLFSK